MIMYEGKTDSQTTCNKPNQVNSLLTEMVRYGLAVWQKQDGIQNELP